MEIIVKGISGSSPLFIKSTAIHIIKAIVTNTHDNLIDLKLIYISISSGFLSLIKIPPCLRCKNIFTLIVDEGTKNVNNFLHYSSKDYE